MSAVKSFLLVAAALLTLLTCAGWLDPYADTINRANLLLREGNYDEALRLYENSVVERPGDLTGRLNSAIALYAADKYEDSLSRFEYVLEQIASRRVEYPAETAGLVERIARYGAGSAEFRLGFASESLSGLTAGGQVPPPRDSLQPSDSLAAAVTHYRRAVRHFYEALRLHPGDDDARHNYRLAYSRLSELEQMLEQGEEGEQEEQGERGEQDDQDTQTDGSSSDEDQSKEGGAEQEEPYGTVSPQSQEERQDEGDRQDQISMSPEEALRLLEMMSDEEVHGIQLRQELEEESTDYLDW